MPSLLEAIALTEAIAKEVSQQPKPIEECNQFVEAIIGVLSCGLYPGLSLWSIVKLIQRLDLQQLSTFPLGRRLRFASKTVFLITSSLAENSDLSKARAFIRCLLNTGYLTATIEFLSCIGTANRMCKIDDSDQQELVGDVWGYLLSSGEVTVAQEELSINKLLQPFIVDGSSILRASSRDPLSSLYWRFLMAVGSLGGPPLALFLEGNATSGTGFFALELHKEGEADPNIEPVFITESCVPLHIDPVTQTPQSPPTSGQPQSEDPSSPTPKKKVVKKIVVKKRVLKSDTSAGPSPSETVQSPTSPAAAAAPSQSEHDFTDSPFDCEFREGEIFANASAALREAIADATLFLSTVSLSSDAFQINSAAEGQSPSMDMQWIEQTMTVLAVAPAAVKSYIEAGIEEEVLALSSEVA